MIWVLACSTSPWSESAALQPTLSRLDTDQDGHATAAELSAIAPELDFGLLDTDRDETLSVPELAAWMDAADPLTFDHRFGRQPVTRQQAASSESVRPEVRMLMDLYLFLSEELIAADPAIPRPGEHLLRAAAATASLSSPESHAVLASLREGFATAGLTWPPGLEAR